MCRLLFQPRTPGVRGKDVASEIYNFRSYEECSLAVSVGEKYIVRRERGDRGPALKVLDENDRSQLGHLQRELVSVLWPLTDKIEV